MSSIFIIKRFYISAVFLLVNQCAAPPNQQVSEKIHLKNGDWQTAQIVTKYRPGGYAHCSYTHPTIFWTLRFGNGSCYNLTHDYGPDIPKKIMETPSLIKLSPDEKTLLFSQDDGLSWKVVFLDVGQRGTAHEDPHDAFKFHGQRDHTCEPILAEVSNHPFFCQHLTLETQIPDWSAIPTAKDIAIDIIRSGYRGDPPKFVNIKHKNMIHAEEILMALTYACSHLDDELIQKTLVENDLLENCAF